MTENFQYHFPGSVSIRRKFLASLLGKFLAYLMGQLFVSFDVLDFFQLNIISFTSVSIAFTIALFLPRAMFSEIFNRRPVELNTIENEVYSEQANMLLIDW